VVLPRWVVGGSWYAVRCGALWVRGSIGRCVGGGWCWSVAAWWVVRAWVPHRHAQDALATLRRSPAERANASKSALGGVLERSAVARARGVPSQLEAAFAQGVVARTRCAGPTCVACTRVSGRSLARTPARARVQGPARALRGVPPRSRARPAARNHAGVPPCVRARTWLGPFCTQFHARTRTLLGSFSRCVFFSPFPTRVPRARARARLR